MKKILLFLLLNSLNSFSQSFDYKDYNSFLSKYVSNDGNVNYAKIKKNNSQLDVVIAQFEKNQPSEKWLDYEKMAYYINVYNAYTIKVVIDNYPTKSIKDIKNAWTKKIVPSGKSKISLSFIENKILRKMDDPRTHFAINCASFSCPILSNKAYIPKTLDKQLDKAAKIFVKDKSKNDITADEIKISKIFNWYSSDFKSSDKNIVNYINKYSKTKINAAAKISYLDYDWSLNQ